MPISPPCRHVRNARLAASLGRLTTKVCGRSSNRIASDETQLTAVGWEPSDQFQCARDVGNWGDERTFGGAEEST